MKTISRKGEYIVEQKKEYKRLEIEVIDYEYEDVITTSTVMPER